MQYKIVKARSENGLTESVGEHLSEGWRPQGGVSLQFRGVSGISEIWIQAMVKED